MKSKNLKDIDMLLKTAYDGKASDVQISWRDLPQLVWYKELIDQTDPANDDTNNADGDDLKEKYHHPDLEERHLKIALLSSAIKLSTKILEPIANEHVGISEEQQGFREN
ncbi:hypothetical protein ILUMI_16576 [Ignelater luminosus]|uniref:Uncharacterized protein n=1 Tax=Ignelater luminosus TaxID=2038154 RepID=A0A8K0CSN8_IGNLU|nr:hypothetical protein ILUMI_16576 [Ignelater luminosus]